MIEIIDFGDFKEKIPNTYGYISLGEFKLPDEFEYIQKDYYYKATCKIGEKTIDLIVVQIYNSATVLGDLTNIPGNFLVDQEELYTALRNKIKELTLRINDQWGIGWKDTTSTTTSSITNNFTYYDTKS